MTPWLLNSRWPLFAFCTLALVLGLLADAYEYDPDEGLNLMKSALVVRGHSLYREIWSDQPPVFTYLLAWWFEATTMSVTSGRILVLAFSALLLWSLHQTVRVFHDDRQACLAVVLLATSTWYLRLSFSVMIGLPALAIAMAAVWMLAEYRRRGHIASAAAGGALLAVSVQTKIFAVVLVPMLLALCLAPLPARFAPLSPLRRVSGLLICAATAAAVFGAIVCAAQVDFHQLITTHVIASEQGEDPARPRALTLLRRDWHLLLLLAIACAMLRRATLWAGLLPFIWFATAAIALQMHRPVWKHHSLLLSIPAAWAASGSLQMLWHHVAGKWRGSGDGAHPAYLPLAILGGAISTWVVYSGVRGSVRLFESTGESQRQLVQIMRSYAPQTRWVFADRLMPPFRAGLRVPPPLAVMSAKRQQTGQLTDQTVLEALRQYRPEQIAIGRLEYGPLVHEFISENYRRTWKNRVLSHYLRNDLAQNTGQGAQAGE